MGSYWWNVFKEAIFSSAEAVGYSRQTLIYVALVLGLTAWRVWLPQGWKAMKENLATTIGEVILIGIIAWLPFFLFHIANVSYGRWKTENERANTAADEYRKYKEGRAVPDLHVELNSTIDAPAGENDKDVMIGALGRITNTGTPGAAVDFWLDLEINGKTVHGELPVPPNPEQKFNIGKTPEGKEIALQGDSYWMKTATKQIPTNDYANGWILAVFRDVTQAELRKFSPTLIVTCSDVMGKKSSGRHTIGTAPEARPFGLGDIQKHKH